MFEQVFTEIAKKPNCNYRKDDFSVNGRIGAKLPVTIHYLNIIFDGTSIDLRYDLGNHNTAEVSASIETKSKIPEIEILTRSHFSRLFSLKKNAWKIKCSSERLKLNFIQMLKNSGLTKIANTEGFEPEIKAQFKDEKYSIHTQYYLGFNGKENSIVPMIEFYKSLIQSIKRY